MRNEKDMEAVLNVLRKANAPLSMLEIHRRSNVTYDRIRHAIETLRNDKHIKSKGKYLRRKYYAT
jgi:predicted transcriptional regulator